MLPCVLSHRRAACALSIALFCAPAIARAQGSATIIAGAPEQSYPSLKIIGFTDVDYAASDRSGQTEGFTLGQFVLHFTSPLARKVNFFGEVSMTPASDQFKLEVERSFIRYDYNDQFKISGGRYHTPLGYWNTAYHHGLWLQTTVRRPEQVKVGGIYIPVHFLGVLAEGKLPSGALGLAYAAGLGNGRADILSRDGDAGDANSNRAWLAQLVARPLHIYGLEAGTAIYQDLLPRTGQSSVREWIYSAHAVWTRESPELIAEFIGVRHEVEGTSTSYDDRSFYVQGAYRLPGWASRVKPYSRYDRMEIASGDPVYPLPDLKVVTGGVRVDLIDVAAVKAEYRNELTEGTGRTNTFLFQACFTF